MWGISSQLFQQAQPLLLTLNEGYLLTTTPPDLELGIGPLGTASLVAQMVKRLPAMRETQVRSLGWEEPLEKGMTTHCSILTWRIPWTEKPGGLQLMGSQRDRHDRVTEHSTVMSSRNLCAFLFILPSLGVSTVSSWSQGGCCSSWHHMPT